MFQEGTSFWVSADPHLWFVISDPAIDEERVLYVNVTSWDDSRQPSNPSNDSACILYPEDHPSFIKHKSCVYYYGAQIAGLHSLERKLAKGKIQFEGRASPQLVAKIREKAGDSIHMQPDAYQILDDQGLV